MIIEKIYKKAEKDRHRLYPQHANRCSSIGYPCDRFLVYSIVRWKDKTIPPVSLQVIFNEGNRQERVIRRDIDDIGIDILKAGHGVSFEKERLFGSIDGTFKYRRSELLLELKSMSCNIFPKMNTESDFINSKHPWHQCYMPQFQLYLKGMGLKRGLFIMKNKNTGELKELEIKYDRFMAAAYLTRCEHINARVNKIREVLEEQYQIKEIADFDKMTDVKDYLEIRNDACKLIEDYMPERICDFDMCKYCPFEHICLPDEIRQQQARIMINKEYEKKLNNREKLVDIKKLYDKLDKEVKDIAKETRFDSFICGNFEIRINKTEKQTRVDINRLE